MNKFPKKLQSQLDSRQKNNTYRQLSNETYLIDFASNDYLGFATSKSIFEHTHNYLKENSIVKNGATGSRLLSGNHLLYKEVEEQLCEFHNAEAALILNSGYTANLGFFSSVPRRGDIIFYDELIHASIRDGIQLSHAKSYKFKHNDLNHLNKMLKRLRHNNEVYVVTESVFSMDGDSPDLIALSKLCKTENIHLVIDEAHALGIFGKHGCGLVQQFDIENEVFARIITFGKALGCHGAAILGSDLLKSYLINFSRPFIYTTGLSPHTLATIKTSYNHLTLKNSTIEQLHKNILHFNTEISRFQINNSFIYSNSAIQCCIISGNNKVKHIANHIQNQGFDVKPILSPTVPENQERLRFCLHSYNSHEEISTVLEILSNFDLEKE